LSISGTISPPLRVKIVDTAIGAGLFVVLTMLVISLIALDAGGSVPVPEILPQALVGLIIGAAIRSLRWVSIPIVTEPSGTAEALRPLAAFGIATFSCIAAGRLGMDVRAASVWWIGLAPAAAVAASLDIWLENSQPHSLLGDQARADRLWVTPAFVAFTILIVAMNFGYELVRTNLAAQGAPKPKEDAHLVRLPEDLDSSGPTARSVRIGQPFEIWAAVDGIYGLVADPKAALYLKQIGPRATESPATGDPTNIVVKMEKSGRYIVCITQPESQPGCTSPKVRNLIYLGILVVSGDMPSIYKISISSAGSQ
jgi:hypothetical protein